MKKVFLDVLPRGGKFLKDNVINWKASVGYKVKFIYDDIEGHIEIMDYNPKTEKLLIKYNNKKFEIRSRHFKLCKLGELLGKHTKEFYYEIGKIFKDNKRDLVIIDREYRKIKDTRGNDVNKKYYKYRCNKDKYEGWILESNLKNGNGCACCNNKVVILGINTIWDTDKWMVPYVGEEIAKNYTHSSSKKIHPRCPDCGKVKDKLMSINTLYTYKTIFCTCSDGISFPEKFMLNLLEHLKEKNQLNDYVYQYTKTNANWCNNYRYDFYFEYDDEKYIIETHGKQHYKDSTGVFTTLEEQQEIDKIKKELAINNGIKEENYIVIDCRKSELDFIKQNILRSRLNEIFDLKKIDWDEVLFNSMSNKIKEAYTYWINGTHNTKEIATIMKLSPLTIHRYLQKSTEIFNWTYEYHSDFEPKRVKCLNDNKIYNSIREASKYYNCDESGISAVCRNKRKTIYGLKFIYYDE